MNSFRTTINIQKSNFEINYNTSSFFIGSCFTQNIGNKFHDIKLPSIINPFGVLYNPASINNSLKILLNKKVFIDEDLVFFNDKWFSFYHHSSFSNSDKKECLQKINNEMNKASEFLRNCDFLFITFGTSRVYKNLKTNKIVSNCHKIPAKEFEHQLLTSDEMASIYSNLIKDLLQINSKLKIVFTVSPIRHLKDTAPGNLLSKSILIVSIYKLLEEFKNCRYFPAYEIMMDDLRDYRFYEADMIHPNKVAISYIWNLFSDIYIGRNTKQIVKDIEKINVARQHKPVNVNSESFKKFVRSNIEKVNDLKAKHPNIYFDADLEYFNNFIVK